MSVMSKKKTTGRARDKGETKPFTLELPVALDEALERFAAADRRTKKAITIIALESLLKENGFWPPPSPPQP